MTQEIQRPDNHDDRQTFPNGCPYMHIGDKPKWKEFNRKLRGIVILLLIDIRWARCAVQHNLHRADSFGCIEITAFKQCQPGSSPPREKITVICATHPSEVC